MALGQFNQIQHYFITQTFTLTIAIIYIAVLHSLGYNVKYFLYSSPILLLLMIAYYYMFWKRPTQVFRCFCLINLILFIISSVSYFAVFYGVFNKTLAYTTEKIQSCQIIGQMTSNLSNNENYSILYVNYIKNGHNMLGYACKSNLSDSSLMSRINPTDFYFYNSKYPCSRTSSSSVNNNNINNNRVLKVEHQKEQDAQNRKNSLNIRKRLLDGGDKPCVDYYTFSEVKLASWMCIDENTSFDDMMKLGTCYIHDYQNSSTGQKEKASANAAERKSLKKITSFTLVQFDDTPVPSRYLLLIIIFAFYPFLISTNIFSLFLTQFIMKFYTQFSNNNQPTSSYLEKEQILNIDNQSEKGSEKQYQIDSPSSDVPSKYQTTNTMQLQENKMQLQEYRMQLQENRMQLQENRMQLQENRMQLQGNVNANPTQQMSYMLQPVSDEEILQMKIKYKMQFVDNNSTLSNNSKKEVSTSQSQDICKISTIFSASDQINMIQNDNSTNICKSDPSPKESPFCMPILKSDEELDEIEEQNI